MHEAPIALLIPPDLPPPVPGRAMPTPVLARPAEPAAADLGPILIGVAALDGSGRVREHTLLAEIGWACGEALEVLISPGAALFRRSPKGRIRVDERGQIAISSGCRDVLMIEPGSRIVLAALPARGALLVLPMPVAASWIRPHLTRFRDIFDG